ncbi:MAG: DUF4157 domain-containing protein [Moorea sp. SIO3C2]|nr:DUF4157 domain-containing protein [Moorena sp. SIO3C2]
MGSRRRHEEDRDWNAEEAVGEWGSRMANVMHSLETGQYVPDTGWYEMGLQAKLTIGQPGDKYEQEADRVARQVVQQINSPLIVEEEVLGTPQQEIQRKALTGATLAPQNLEGSIKEARGRGKPLEERIRIPLEQSMGADFRGVRVHTDAQSDLMNKSIQAKAFTTGQDVFFRQGEYQPGTRGGQELIAHELTHVQQQRRLGSPYGPRYIRDAQGNRKTGGGGGKEKQEKKMIEMQSNGKGVYRDNIGLIETGGRVKLSRMLAPNRALLGAGARIGLKTVKGTLTGHSGSSDDVDKNLIRDETQVAMYNILKSYKKRMTGEDGKTYVRDGTDCAEPHAYSQYVKAIPELVKFYAEKGWNIEEIRSKLIDVQYDEKAAYKGEKAHELPYCHVCQNWINKDGKVKGVMRQLLLQSIDREYESWLTDKSLQAKP